MLRSAPVANERRVLAQRSSRRIAPDKRAATPKVMVSGSRSWVALVMPAAWMSGWAAGSWNIRSGAVRTARNGSTAPMLRISANEALTINTRSRANCPRRLGLMWSQRRRRSVVMLGVKCIFFGEPFRVIPLFCLLE